MSDIFIAQYFRKDISKSTHFLRNIWYPKTDTDEHKHELYRCCCSSSTKYCFVNDFVNKRSCICSELQHNQAVNIHVNNVEYLHCNTRDKRPTKDGVRTSDIESDNGQSLLKGNRLRHAIYNTSKAWTPEDLITDEFLNKMHIPQGEVKQEITLFLAKRNYFFTKHISIILRTAYPTTAPEFTLDFSDFK